MRTECFAIPSFAFLPKLEGFGQEPFGDVAEQLLITVASIYGLLIR